MKENIKERIKEYSKLINKYPDIKELYIERAKLYDKIQNYKKAVEDFKKAYKDYYACKNIITVCENVGLKQEAEKFYTQAIKANKNNVQNYIDRIYFYMRYGEIEKVILDCKETLKLFPKDETILALQKILTKK